MAVDRPRNLTPGNDVGYQVPSTGNAYTGLLTYWNSFFGREIITGQLSSPLSISQKYFVSFMVNRSNDTAFSGYSTNKMGVKLSTAKLDVVAINNTAKYFSNTIITDTLNWTKLFGSFIADSAYNFLLIGNFFDDANTTITNQSAGIYAYYFVDDVCISTDSLFTLNYETNIKTKHKDKIELRFFPNPISETLTIALQGSYHLKLLNDIGSCVFAKNFYDLGFVDTRNLPNGLYFIQVTSDNQVYTDKVVVRH